MQRRKVEIAIISDLHLGTYGCQANQILEYLRSIDPEVLILNGDIIDMWNFSKSYFPKSHIQVMRQILKITQSGTKTYYLTGNHDEALRKYSGTTLGNLVIDDKLVLDIDGQKVWIFHGDIFDATTKGSAKIIAKLGGKGYDILIWINKLINDLLHFFGKEKVSISKRIKSSIKSAVKWVGNFETTAAELAIEQGYQVVICGHIHQPQLRHISVGEAKVMYLNSGDWVEHCTALEYNHKEWKIYTHDPKLMTVPIDIEEIIDLTPSMAANILDSIDLRKLGIL